MLAYQWTSAAIGIIIACSIIYLVRHDYLRTDYAVWWVATALGVVVCSVRPQLIDAIGARLGISYPPVLLVIVGMGLLLIKVLTMDIERSKQERKIRRLVQKIALMEGGLGGDDSPPKDDERLKGDD